MTTITVAPEERIAPKSKKPVRIGFIGAGAVTELCHAPALSRVAGARLTAVVDLCDRRARNIVGADAETRFSSHYQDALEHVDAVVLALPHHLHAPVAIDCLSHGVSVLVEKPLARTVAESESMIEAAGRSDALLQVGLMYRFCDGPRFLHRAVHRGVLGSVQAFELECGSVYDWPVASGFFFDREQAGGGVLIDTGSHMLDLLCWLIGRPRAVEYRDDSRGGVEADCEARIQFDGPQGPVTGVMRLSRLRQLRDRLRIVGEQWTAEYDIGSTCNVRLQPAGDSATLLFGNDTNAAAPQTWSDVYAAQMEAFVNAVATGRTSPLSAERTLPSLALIEQCYRERTQLTHPWEDAT